MTSSTEESRAARSAPRGTSKLSPAFPIVLLARTMRWAIVTSLDRKARAISSVVRPPTTRSVSATRASAESTGWQAVKMRPSSSSPRSSLRGHFDHLGRAVDHAVQLARDLLMFALTHLVATDRVDGAAFGGGHQPRAGIGRNAGPRPFGQGNDQSILRQFLCKVDIAHDAGQTRDEPGPFNAKSRFDRLVRLACSHAALSAKP